jgi:hypothetical protein
MRRTRPRYDAIISCETYTGPVAHPRHALSPQPTTLTSQLVKIARRLGAIPYCKTNVPQTLLAFECRNPIFGATSNPHATGRTCGGSSGGEAALLASRGSPLGWGSDSESAFAPRTTRQDAQQKLTAQSAGRSASPLHTRDATASSPCAGAGPLGGSTPRRGGLRVSRWVGRGCTCRCKR